MQILSLLLLCLFGMLLELNFMIQSPIDILQLLSTYWDIQQVVMYLLRYSASSLVQLHLW